MDNRFCVLLWRGRTKILQRILEDTKTTENTIKLLTNVAVPPCISLENFFVKKRKKRCYIKETTVKQLKQRNFFVLSSPRYNFYDSTPLLTRHTRTPDHAFLHNPLHISHNQQSCRTFTGHFTAFCCFCLKFQGGFEILFFFSSSLDSQTF
jgi:hypothetical protein